MSPSLIFRFAVKVFTPVLILLSLVIYWRGHQLPGGGFVGGLMAATALSIHALCWGVNATIQRMRVRPLTILFSGLALALAGALWGPFTGAPFFTGIWGDFPIIGSLGSPMLFDLGVYLVVVGSVTSMLFTLLEEEK